jgi:S-formylglutathione hydrolase FrmB
VIHATFRFPAETLGKATQVEAILPDRLGAARPAPVLYLLHGLSDDQTLWMRRSSIERYADGRNLAVVMPNGDRSFYSDLCDGSRYFAYLTEELPAVVESLLPVSRERAGRFIAGLSMGGWGALKAALNRPERYAAAAGLSSVCDLNWLREGNPALYAANFGPDYVPALPNDLFAAAEKVSSLPPEERPALFQYCGEGDFLWSDNLRFRDHLRSLGLEPHWEQGPGGHTWDNWDERIRHVLDWIAALQRS